MPPETRKSATAHCPKSGTHNPTQIITSPGTYGIYSLGRCRDCKRQLKFMSMTTGRRAEWESILKLTHEEESSGTS